MVILVLVTCIMCVAIRDTHDYDDAEAVNKVTETRPKKHPKNGSRKDSDNQQNEEKTARRRSDTHKSHPETPFYFHRDGFAHFHPPVAIFG